MTDAWQKNRDDRTLTGRPWRRLREQVMNRDGWICQVCKRKGKVTEATQCDHIVPVSKQGDNTPANLQAICDACHEAKTQREAGNTGHVKAEIGVDGWHL
jgi:5-methylcytosine-specific restriction protein A